MATADDGRSPYESSAAEERFRKRPPEIYEESQDVSHEAGRNNSTGESELRIHEGGNFATISATIGISELEQILKHKTLTRSEAQRLIALVHSRIMEEELPSSLFKLEASGISGSLKRHKHGDDMNNFHASVALEEEIGSPAQLANAYKDSTSGTRFSKQHPATMGNLPNEILSNIFICLLAKQVAQMRSVSKSWNSLLSQPSFVKSHLHRSLHHNDQILLVFYDKDNFSSDSKYFTAHSCRSPHLELSNFIKPPVNPRPRPGYGNNFMVIGAVNGLICSCYGDSVIQIWNPSLSAMFTLPPYFMPSHCHDSMQIDLRFGFDPRTYDYKVVKLAQLSGLRGPDMWLQTEIYSMRKGTWELITGRFPSHITDIIDSDHVCADGRDGRLHWLCCNNEEGNSDRIVALDLVSETFREIPLPHPTLDSECAITLGVLARNLCVMSWFEDDGTCEVWVMEEYGVAESWVKRHVFSPIIGFSYAFGSTSGNKFLIQDKNGDLVLYDPSVNEQKILKDHRRRIYHVDKIVEYVDSLVWVAPDKR